VLKQAWPPNNSRVKTTLELKGQAAWCQVVPAAKCKTMADNNKRQPELLSE